MGQVGLNPSLLERCLSLGAYGVDTCSGEGRAYVQINKEGRQGLAVLA